MRRNDMSLVHLNLLVADVDRSINFYRRWFGFDAPPRRYPDGTVAKIWDP